MEAECDRSIIATSDGDVSAYRKRELFNRLASKHGLLEGSVYCPDGTVRRMLGHTDVRMEWHFWSLVFLNPIYNAIPILSEPIGTYEFRELKLLVAKHIRRVRHSIAGGGPELKAQLERATTFDDLLDLIAPVSITI